jgi:hypothetical protein
MKEICNENFITMLQVRMNDFDDKVRKNMDYIQLLHKGQHDDEKKMKSFVEGNFVL